MRPIYSKDKGVFWLDAGFGLPNGTIDGSLVSSWNDLVLGVSFQNSNSSWQPTYRSSDIDFNGLPVIHFTSAGRGLTSFNLSGPTIGTSQTVAVVYQYITQTVGLYAHNCIIGNEETYLTPNQPRFNFITLNHNAPHTNNLGIGYWQGSNSVSQFINGSTTIFDFLPRILIISGNALIYNGTSITKTNNGIIASTGNMLGAGRLQNTTAGGAWKLAELIVWNENYSVSDCLDISSELNTKYAIY